MCALSPFVIYFPIFHYMKWKGLHLEEAKSSQGRGKAGCEREQKYSTSYKTCRYHGVIISSNTLPGPSFNGYTFSRPVFLVEISHRVPTGNGSAIIGLWSSIQYAIAVQKSLFLVRLMPYFVSPPEAPGLLA